MSTGLSIQEFKIDFQDGDCGDHLGFPMRTILAIFDLLFPTKFQVSWNFGSLEVQKRVSRKPPSWISNLNDFSYF